MPMPENFDRDLTGVCGQLEKDLINRRSLFSPVPEVQISPSVDEKLDLILEELAKIKKEIRRLDSSIPDEFKPHELVY